MQSTALQSLPPKLRRSLAKLGGDISTARRKRSLTAVMMAERIGLESDTKRFRNAVFRRRSIGEPIVHPKDRPPEVMGIYKRAHRRDRAGKLVPGYRPASSRAFWPMGGRIPSQFSWGYPRGTDLD